MSSTIHIASPGTEATTYPEVDIRGLWKEGHFPADALYWKEGMSEWRPLTEYFNTSSLSPAPGVLPPSLPTDLGYQHAYAKDPKGRLTFLIVMLFLILGMEVVSLTGDTAQLYLLNTQYTESEAETMNIVQGLIGLLYMLIYLITAISFFMWKSQANLNCRSFGAQDMKFTPGWCVGWYFIPFANLVQPYKAMKEIWQVSKNPLNWQSQSGSSLMGWWWALWLLSGLFGQISFRLSMSADTLEMIQVSTVATMVVSVLGIPLTLLLLVMVKRIARFQENWVRGITSN